jgi:hypothetical protein
MLKGNCKAELHTSYAVDITVRKREFIPKFTHDIVCS